MVRALAGELRALGLGAGFMEEGMSELGYSVVWRTDQREQD